MNTENFCVKIYPKINASYKGQLNKNGKWEGFGVYITNSGVYEGEWLSDKRCGQGY
jgi:hypothetical protein